MALIEGTSLLAIVELVIVSFIVLVACLALLTIVKEIVFAACLVVMSGIGWLLDKLWLTRLNSWMG